MDVTFCSLSLNEELFLQSGTGLVRAVQCTKNESELQYHVCDTVLHVYVPVYKPVVQRYILLTCFFSIVT